MTDCEKTLLFQKLLKLNQSCTHPFTHPEKGIAVLLWSSDIEALLEEYMHDYHVTIGRKGRAKSMANSTKESRSAHAKAMLKKRWNTE